MGDMMWTVKLDDSDVDSDVVVRCAIRHVSYGTGFAASITNGKGNIKQASCASAADGREWIAKAIASHPEWVALTHPVVPPVAR